MMKSALLFFFSGLFLYANEGHVHEHYKGCKHNLLKENVAVQMEADRNDIEKSAKKKIQMLVKGKKIPKSWKNVPVKNIEKTKNNTKDWVVSFYNEKIKKDSRQTLYIFVSIHGKVVGANYSGK